MVPRKIHSLFKPFYALNGLGPNFLTLSVISLTDSVNLPASAPDMKNISSLSPPIPSSSRICFPNLTLSSALKFPVSNAHSFGFQPATNTASAPFWNALNA